MATALQTWIPDSQTVLGAVISVLAAAAATLYVLDGSVRYAAIVAGSILLFDLSRDLADAVVGDYAGNALFGVVVLAGAGYFASLSASQWFVTGLALCGGWLLLDGGQHLRHGVTRDEVGVPYRHEGSAVTGLAKALFARLAEPVLLSRRSG